MRKLIERLLAAPPSETNGSLWAQEEARAERLAGLLRVVYLVVWLLITTFTRHVNSAVANGINLWGGLAWLLFAVGYQALLSRRPYRSAYKYLSLTGDLLFSFGMLFLYQFDDIGYPASLKSPTFMNAFLVLGLATLRFDWRLPLFGGVLAMGLYGAVILFCVATGRIAFGTRADMFTTAKVSGAFLGFNTAYLALFTAVLVVLVRNTRRLVRLRAEEAARTLEEHHERERLKGTLERYFSPNVARHLMDNPPALGGRTQMATILFLDIRDFTRISEKMGPQGSVRFLNDVFAKLVEVVFRHGGTLDKFLGDGMLVAFGVPEEKPDDALRAVRAADEMARAAEVAGDWAGLQVGMALHTGEVLMGNIGTPARMEFTVIGDTVNTASRMEHLNKSFRTTILLSEATFSAVKDVVSAREMPVTGLAGKEEWVRLYEFTGWKKL